MRPAGTFTVIIGLLFILQDVLAFQFARFLKKRQTSALMARKKEVVDEFDEAGAFKTGSHTYASWKQGKRDESGGIIESEGEELIDADFDDGTDIVRDEEPGNFFLAWIRKLYYAIFFYGLDPPLRRGSGAAIKRRKKRRKSMFFTPGEEISQDIISEGIPLKKFSARKRHDADEDVEIESVSEVSRMPFVSKSGVKDIELELAYNTEQINVLEVSIALQREETGVPEEEDAKLKRLVDRRNDLVARNEALERILVDKLVNEEVKVEDGEYA